MPLDMHYESRDLSRVADTPHSQSSRKAVAQEGTRDSALGRFDVQGVDLITFEKGQRKDDITQKYLRKFKKSEGVLYVGKAQEKARIMRTERRRCKRTGATYPWIVQTTAMVNHYYFYGVDAEFGPFFLKFCSYFPYNAKLCINGHEYLKRQLAKWGVAFEALDNGIKSCADPALLQRLADGLTAEKIERAAAQVAAPIATSRSPHAIAPPAIAMTCQSCRRSSPSPRCSTNLLQVASSSRK